MAKKKQAEANWQIDVGSIAQQLGMSEADAKEWLSNQGFTPQTTQAQFDSAKKDFQPSDGLGNAGNIANKLVGAVGPNNPVAWTLENIGGLGAPELIRLLGSGAEKALSSATGSGGAGAKTDPKKKAGGSTSESAALEQLAKWLTQNYTEQGALAMGQQGQQLAQQNQYVTSLVDQQMQQAGAASGNPAVAAAMDAYTKAYSGGEALNSVAYGNMGGANAQYLSQSPLYPIANLLTQGFGSTQYKELPPSVVQALPANVQAALAQAGVTESSAAGGSGTPIPVAKGASANSPTNLAQILGLTSPATNPQINTSLNQTLTPGAPSNPTS